MAAKAVTAEANLEARVRELVSDGVSRTYADIAKALEAPMQQVEWAVLQVAREAGYTKTGEVGPFWLGEFLRASDGAQGGLPGIPLPELWPKFDGFKVHDVYLGFAGGIKAPDADVSKYLVLGNRVRLIVDARVTGRKFRLEGGKDGIESAGGSATLTVEDLHFMGPDASPHPLRVLDVPDGAGEA